MANRLPIVRAMDCSTFEEMEALLSKDGPPDAELLDIARRTFCEPSTATGEELDRLFYHDLVCLNVNQIACYKVSEIPPDVLARILEGFDFATDEEMAALMEGETLEEMLAAEPGDLPIQIDEDFLAWDRVPGPAMDDDEEAPDV